MKDSQARAIGKRAKKAIDGQSRGLKHQCIAV
jgi:hypothetical protein